ncbi:PREDICTED: interactor of constitutive active ROPs 4-like [Tarenaya hassleriana]|uniref:interactor of constitutive active ROPs 4-like n=1 Tax=Tarenaya hassleriana TaxID=28532 RepID=UPI00053C646C|nr:PREDICTED: interactor of constitutive active ROPs 4-like [Tarenaya hassleriana]XP_010537681.1 PREDICTED: interactor of constitutive active ROPs 4-like [Tarenaya hassleriana]XP_010537682.1 PREDICTED: interactor of constitutive active ROPs 4-like [Tarenaya hassleriana]
MPRSRGSELPQRQSPRLRTSAAASDSDNHPPHHHHRPITDRSPKLGLDRRSPRSGGPHSDPLNQKKLGTRIADLESQLGQAQDELRVLKEQLATAEAAKKQAQEELQKKVKKPNNVARVEGPVPGSKTTDRDEVPGDAQPETDVFEVPVEKITIEPKTDQENEAREVEKPKPDESASKEEEINTLKAKLYDIEKERESLGKENEDLKNQLNDTASEMSNVKAKEEEMASKMNQIGKELEETQANAAQLKEKLESTEEAKEELETEMKKLRVQTEQWRKAADAAAAVLAGGVEMNGRVSERCGSMEKHLTGGLFEAGGFVGSPGMAEDSDDGFGSGKRKGSGIKKLGDLWRKKGQK